MEISIFLAKAFSVYFLVMGVAVILRRHWLQAVFADLLNSKASMFIIAILTLILGILLIISHPAFTCDWRSVITVLAWLTFIKGLVYVFFADKLMPFKQKMLAYSAVYYISGIVCLLLGVYLGCQGFCPILH